MRPNLLAGFDPRVKMVAFLAVQALLFVPTGQPLVVRLLAVAAPLLALLPFAGKSWRRWLRLLALAAPFLAFLILSAALQPAASRPQLLRIVLPILGKSMLVFLALALFILNEKPWRLLQALRQIGLPNSAVVILTIGCRFAGQWRLELESMHRAWTSRNFRALPKWRRAGYLGSALPLFFEKLLEGGIHIHDAMASRGFNGSLLSWQYLLFSRRDAAFMGLTTMTVMAIAML